MSDEKTVESTETTDQPQTASAATAATAADDNGNVVALDEPEEAFRDKIYGAKHHDGCVIEKDVPCDLRAMMSAEVVELRHGKWVPTGDIVDNHNPWGVRVRFTYYGRLARCLAGKLKITAWWDGFSNLPEDQNAVVLPVDPCRRRQQYEAVVRVTGLKCDKHQGVYDLAATLAFLCCDREAIVFGHCDLGAIHVTC